MNTLDAIANLPSRLAGDEIHVAFTVTVDFDGQPQLWISDRNGKSHPVTAYTQHDPDDEDDNRRPAAWSYADLALASRYLRQLHEGIIYKRQPDLATAHKEALAGLARAQEFAMRSDLEAAATKSKHEADNPFACSCDRRFATMRGLAMHVARTRYGTHAPKETASR